MRAAGPDAGMTSAAGRLLQWTFWFAVLAFAWLRFSENTADNDLWGHVLYGGRMLALRQIEPTDVLSWTAAGQPWTNHEVAAEITLALVHRAAGSGGLWCLMISLAAVTLAWAVTDGTRGRTQVSVTLALLAASTNFIALGYAVRPQLFTMLAFVAMLAVLRRWLDGRLAWGWLLPPLLAAWVNFHGGYLAGWLVLLLALGVELAARLWRRHGYDRQRGDERQRVGADRGSSPETTLARPRVAHFVLLAVACTAALALNPHGFGLLAWTVQTVQLPRPAISEWHPLPISVATLPFHGVVAITLAAWFFSRKPRSAWQAVVLAVLALMAMRQQRHAPLFGLANLMFTPEHLADSWRRLAPWCGHLLTLFRRPVTQAVAALLLLAGGGAAIAAGVGSRSNLFAMEVPADVYPLSAIRFIREHALHGNMVTFFDWGQQVLWELPHNPVSFDGRLDTVYPQSVMDGHWRFYAGGCPEPSFDLTRAAVALLPTGSGGTETLRRNGWHLAYHDPLATVLVRTRADFPLLGGRGQPVTGGLAAIRGRARFPDALPLLATAARPR